MISLYLNGLHIYLIRNATGMPYFTSSFTNWHTELGPRNKFKEWTPFIIGLLLWANFKKRSI